MRKLLIASVLVSLCVADFGAFAATTGRGGRTANAQNATTAKVENNVASVRAAVRRTVNNTNPVKNNASTNNVAPTTTTASTTATARVAKKTTVTKPTTVARAATQKVINMGTKVAGATENTVVSQECQDAYYGCMDAFCMLDNTSGGRCQCSDRNADLDLVLEEIMALDEQSYAMATEGVERLQMGESADEIMARAKAAADGVINSDKKTLGASNKTKVRQLDLNAWKNNDLFAEEDDIFAGLDSVQTVQNDLANKTGDALQKAAADLCAKQIPAQCAKSTSFLQLTYAQKIKSDCSAYENSLKQQRNASAEKLQTAQKALRDAALEAYQNENKYDFGQCVVRFKQCLQTTAECGDDYSGCVADTAILDTLYNKKNSNKGVATTTIKTGATSIKISSATYDILNTKKIMCESVTKQCVNANKKGEVWQQVLKDLAPVVYTAEYNAASNNRMNCISTVVSCVQKSCGSQWDEQTDNFDACLSDPNSIENYCKLEYQRCGADDASGSVRKYIMAKLSALKVDKCTQDIKECLLSEDRCGSDYSGCVGLDSDSIVDLCPESKLLSCQDRSDGKEVRDYIAQIAQGLALNIDNKFATACQNAVEAAFERVCGVSAEGDEEGNVGCPNLDLNFRTLGNSLGVGFYDKTDHELYDALDQYVKNKKLSITDETNHLRKIFDLQALIRGQIGVDQIQFDETGQVVKEKGYRGGDYFYVTSDYASKYVESPDNSSYDGYDGDIESLLGEMSAKYKSMIDQIESDTTVQNCMVGRTFRGFNGKTQNDSNKANTNGEGNAYTTIGRKGGAEGRFPELTKSVRLQLAYAILGAVQDKYGEKMLSFEATPANMYREILDYYTERLKAEDAELDKVNEGICKVYTYGGDFSKRDEHVSTYKKIPKYDSETNVCQITTESWSCYDWTWFKRRRCHDGKWKKTGESKDTIQLSYIDSDGNVVKK